MHFSFLQILYNLKKIWFTLINDKYYINDKFTLINDKYYINDKFTLINDKLVSSFLFCKHYIIQRRHNVHW